ncbi:hypothetical protein [Pelomonas aquatica]|jgi:hypothetical protein|uniref:Uncharacterized protein n=1 Tax=Pelomonas aquatica TaxID=431058 RepID=A0A9X4LJN5_9BURK|nr:hypothetical protein [Pelomonas aquatica]MCY4757164.1 hypothetical protein [Pelomonas aquatica]MDG0865351.1 hypothetical protein [Pelomonas aquatica]
MKVFRCAAAVTCLLAFAQAHAAQMVSGRVESIEKPPSSDVGERIKLVGASNICGNSDSAYMNKADQHYASMLESLQLALKQGYVVELFVYPDKVSGRCLIQRIGVYQ